ncbi:MAG TPA: SRPBCC domain-containing protein [Acidimicrobiales bacterium]|nr:SRPBCC domain-containing protein [Acidimicrobiales bacterium]
MAADSGALAIEHEVVIEAPIEVVWRLVTRADGLERWLADRVELDARPQGRGRFVFLGDDEVARVVPVVVEAVEAPRRFAFRWSRPEDGEPQPGSSLSVELTLVAEGPERTRVRVVEHGLESLGWSRADKDRYVDEHRSGWSRLLDRLAGLARRPGA